MVLHEQAVAIAVIGATGSGKSSFVNLASGSSLPACTSLARGSTAKLESSTLSLDGRAVTLIDTPGFSGTVPSVLDVLKLISEYFPRLYGQGIKFAGVIYMYRIADGRMEGSSRDNFQSFCKFCGDTSLRDVVIVSNGNGEPRDAAEGESAHRDGLFMHALDNGARMLRYDGSQASAHAILRHLINRKSTAPPAKTETPNRRADPVCTATDVGAMHEPTDQVEHHTKAPGKLCHEMDAATLAEDKEAKEVLQKEARNSLENIERIRYDLERLVTNVATENSRLEGEKRLYEDAFSVQKIEAELRTRLLEEERRARELAETRRGTAEAQLAEERALWEREKMERGGLTIHGRQQYAKVFACGVVIFALVCVSRFVFDGSSTALL